MSDPIPTARLTLPRMKWIAQAAMNEQLAAAGIPKVGLFLVATPPATSTAPYTFGYAVRDLVSGEQQVIVTATVDPFTGEARAKMHGAP